MRRILIRLCIILGVIIAGGIALGSFAERALIYPFDPRTVAPADVGLATVTARELDINQETLTVWTAPAKRGKPVIFYLHGNAGNLATRDGRFKRFLARGYGLVAPAYRGSSGSTGWPTETALITDVTAIYGQIPLLLPTAKSANVIVYGESLGTAVTLGLLEAIAASDGAQKVPAGVILEAPFTSLPDLAETHYPGTYQLALKLDDTWPSLTRARALTPPLLVLHGTRDTLIPIEQGRQIFSAAPSNQKSFVTVKGAGHTDLWRTDTLPRLWQFIDTYLVK